MDGTWILKSCEGGTSMTETQGPWCFNIQAFVSFGDELQVTDTHSNRLKQNKRMYPDKGLSRDPEEEMQMLLGFEKGLAWRRRAPGPSSTGPSSLQASGRPLVSALLCAFASSLCAVRVSPICSCGRPPSPAPSRTHRQTHARRQAHTHGSRLVCVTGPPGARHPHLIHSTPIRGSRRTPSQKKEESGDEQSP